MATYPYSFNPLREKWLFLPLFWAAIYPVYGQDRYMIALDKSDGSRTEHIIKGMEIIYLLEGQDAKKGRITAIHADMVYTKHDSFSMDRVRFIGYEYHYVTMGRWAAKVVYVGSIVNLFLAYLVYTNAPVYLQPVGDVLAALGLVPMVLSKQWIDHADYHMFDCSLQWRAYITVYP
ncbi:MAG: hypothetical protein HYZ16_03510 [Bacteroidetes bacterium]|nr:hypothetical protein [Bacteroidota bacterium]